ncbi:MAG: nuclear transport factor 2 family protein [Abitibacteriaceae bacterium]|nr:nuclear transport factor 2 family protein [Abditibacteriaceae bacterium]MBV9865825.1 nuclear transport factor 2 family protein [Abditibacteriaceae bacterium]
MKSAEESGATEESTSGKPLPRTGIAGGIFCGLVALALLLLGSAQLGTFLGQRFVASTRLPTANPDLMQSYQAWKLAHSQPVAALMEHYAPESRIIRETGQVQHYNDLVALAQSVRKQHTFDKVSDVKAPQIIISGNVAEVRARHYYQHSNHAYSDCIGDRRLVWQKRDGRWLIVQDYFPTRYTPVPPTPSVLAPRFQHQ